MPITKAATKALRNSRKKYEHNLKLKKNLKDAIKNAKASNLSEVISVIDKAAKKNLIHKNKAARIKSSLYKKLKPKSVKPRTTSKPKSKTKTKSKAKKTTKKTAKRK